MNNVLCLLMALLLLPAVANAEAKKSEPQQVKGILQAYWFPNLGVNKSGETVDKPELTLRFFEGSNKKGKIIELYKNKINTDVLYDSNFTDTDVMKMIYASFDNIPDNFKAYREGYIDQYGTLTYSEASSGVACDHRYYKGKFESFNAIHNEKADTADPVTESGCGSYPYLVMYKKPDNAENVYLKSQADIHAENIHKFSTDDTIVKIKTVNADWMYAALYDDDKPDSVGDIKGYIRKSDLRLLN